MSVTISTSAAAAATAAPGRLRPALSAAATTDARIAHAPRAKATVHSCPIEAVPGGAATGGRPGAKPIDLFGRVPDAPRPDATKPGPPGPDGPAADWPTLDGPAADGR